MLAQRFALKKIQQDDEEDEDEEIQDISGYYGTFYRKKEDLEEISEEDFKKIFN